MFDKTGTLTHGKPEVTRVVLFVPEGVCPQQLFIAIVGLAESNSEHPLGVAVTKFAKRVGLDVLSFRYDNPHTGILCYFAAS